MFAKLPGACLSPVVRFQPAFPSLGTCPAFLSLFLPTGAGEDAPFSAASSLATAVCFVSSPASCAVPGSREKPWATCSYLTLAARFFSAAFFFFKYTAILNGNFIHYNRGVSGLCLDAMEMMPTVCLGEWCLLCWCETNAAA